MLNDGATGYIMRFSFYPGNNSRVSEEVKNANKPANVVLNLLPATFDHKGYIILADNFYGSISLLDDLLERGYYSVMTMRVSRRNFPKNVVLPTSAHRGDVRVFTAPGKNSSSFPIFACSLKDKRVVNMASTLPPRVNIFFYFFLFFHLSHF